VQLDKRTLGGSIIGVLFLILCWGVCCPTAASGETVIDIFGPSIPRFPISVFPYRADDPSGQTSELSNEVLRLIKQDLRISGFFELVDSSQALADPFRAGFTTRQVDWDVLRLLGADIVLGGQIAQEGNSIRLEARTYDQPQRRMVFGKAYRGRKKDLRIMVHRFVDEIIRFYTGALGIFQTQIAFLGKISGTKELYLMDPDGENSRPITQDRSINLSPAWSPDGREIAFISYSGANAHLHLLDIETLKRGVLSGRANMNGPAAWSPDGKQLALTLTIDGNPEIYLIDRSGTILRRLTQHPGIDVSPTWSPDGKELAFVSNRAGGPQIYVLNIPSGRIRRLTYEGKYNTDPDWSPRGDRIAYSGDLDGNFEICTVRPDSSAFTQLTDSPADDESPSWSPDGRYLAFSSTRTGSPQVFIMLYNGENQVQVTHTAGGHTSPAWSPWPRKK
jgi:TolB protein